MTRFRRAAYAMLFVLLGMLGAAMGIVQAQIVMGRPLTPLFLAGVVFLAFVLALDYVILNPPTYHEPLVDPEDFAQKSVEGTDALLCLAPTPAPTLCRSWLNTMQTLFGPYRVVMTDALEDEKVEGTRLCVVPQHAASLLGRLDGAMQWLERFVDGGGTLLVEMPPNEMLDLCGGRSAEGESFARKITRVDAAVAAGWEGESLLRMPFRAHARKVTLESETRTLMEVDGRPGLTAARCGRGTVFALWFHFSAAVSAIRQGGGGKPNVPDILFGVKPSHFLRWGMLKNNTVPFVDLLEHALLRALRTAYPFPVWSSHPGGTSGTLLMTHDEEYAGDDALKVLLPSGEDTVRGTFFVLPDGEMTAEGLEKLRAAGFETGLLWNRFPAHVSRGKWRVNPFRRLAEQADAVGKLMAEGGRPAVCRSHWLRWNRRLVCPLAMMSRTGFRADMSFGPTSSEKGFLFGTGFPFRPLCRRGFVAGIYELPFVVQDRSGGADGAFLEQCMENAGRSGRPPIAVTYRPHVLAGDARALADYRQAYHAARERGYGFATVSEYLDFWEAREAARITSDFDGTELRVECEAPRGGLALRVPGVFDGKVPARYLLDGMEARPHEQGPAPAMLIPEGRHTLIVQYGSKAH